MVSIINSGEYLRDRKACQRVHYWPVLPDSMSSKPRVALPIELPPLYTATRCINPFFRAPASWGSATGLESVILESNSRATVARLVNPHPPPCAWSQQSGTICPVLGNILLFRVYGVREFRSMSQYVGTLACRGFTTHGEKRPYTQRRDSMFDTHRAPVKVEVSHIPYCACTTSTL
jgi:hypothetical protein